MDWDDDGFDADAALEAAEKNKEKGVNSEDEAEAVEEEERLRKEAEEAASKPKPKPKPKKEKVEVYVPLEDKHAERLRRQKLVEEADMRLAWDLFSGLGDDGAAASGVAKSGAASSEANNGPKAEFIVQDLFDDLNLKTQGDVEKLTTTCLDKINRGKAKGAAQKFLVDLLKALEGSLETKELEALTKALAAIEKVKKVEKTTSTNEKKKGNEKLSKTTKFNTSDELSTVYGGAGADEDWEDWEDWEEY